MISASNSVGKYLVISCDNVFDSIQSWIGNNYFLLCFIDILRYRHCRGKYIYIYIYIYIYRYRYRYTYIYIYIKYVYIYNIYIYMYGIYIYIYVWYIYMVYIYIYGGIHGIQHWKIERLFEVAIKGYSEWNWTHDHQIPFRRSNRLSYQDMSSTHTESKLCTASPISSCQIIFFGYCSVLWCL